MARMIDTRSATNISVADAVLRLYDSGTTEKTVILATLMGSYPTLTLYTIDVILRTCRKRKSKKKKPPKPKSAIDIATEEIQALCLKCPLHTYGRACVMPLSLCPYPEVVDLVKKRDDLVAEKKRVLWQKRVSGGTIEYHKHRRNTPKAYDMFEELEQELDDLYNENTFRSEVESRKLYSPGPVANWAMEGVVFKPDVGNNSTDFSHKSLEDYAEVLSASYNPMLKRDSFGFPIDKVGFSSIFEKYKDLYPNPTDEDYQEGDEIEQEFDSENEPNVDFADATDEEDETEIEQQSLDHVVYKQSLIQNPYCADVKSTMIASYGEDVSFDFMEFDGSTQDEAQEPVEPFLTPSVFEIPFEESMAEDNPQSNYTIIDDFDVQDNESFCELVASSSDDVDIAIDSMSFVAEENTELEEAPEYSEIPQTGIFEIPVEKNMFSLHFAQNNKTEFDDFSFKNDEDLCLEDFSDVLAPGILDFQKKISKRGGSKQR